MRAKISILALLVIVVLASMVFIFNDSSGETALIYTEDRTIHYEGAINDSSYQKFKEMLDENPDIDKIIVKSGGGDTVSGRNIGKIIHDRELDVVVDYICLSSCANYIFTAGVKKEILEDSAVGWHGSELQFEILAKNNNTSTEQYIKNVIISELDNSWFFWYSDSDIQMQYDQIIQNIQAEKTYFEIINVDHNIALDGLYIIENSDCQFWTHTIEDMKQFRVHNVTYASDRDYPEGEVLSIYDVCLI